MKSAIAVYVGNDVGGFRALFVTTDDVKGRAAFARLKQKKDFRYPEIIKLTTTEYERLRIDQPKPPPQMKLAFTTNSHRQSTNAYKSILKAGEAQASQPTPTT